MKKIIPYIVIFASCFLISNNLALAQNNSSEPSYDLECTKVNSDGYYTVKVWIMTSKEKNANELAKKFAIRGILFKGIEAGKECNSQKPWIDSPTFENEKSDFFKPFFKSGGKYLNYVSIANNSEPEIIKNKNGNYVGVIVSIAKDELRRDLEKEGIIKSLNSGF